MDLHKSEAFGRCLHGRCEGCHGSRPLPKSASWSLGIVDGCLELDETGPEDA
jgi:hypothetical protein